jgi:hypothetical protein
MTLENLARIGRLQPHAATREAVAAATALLAGVKAWLAAQHPELS